MDSGDRINSRCHLLSIFAVKSLSKRMNILSIQKIHDVKKLTQINLGGRDVIKQRDLLNYKKVGIFLIYTSAKLEIASNYLISIKGV